VTMDIFFSPTDIPAFLVSAMDKGLSKINLSRILIPSFLSGFHFSFFLVSLTFVSLRLMRILLCLVDFGLPPTCTQFIRCPLLDSVQFLYTEVTNPYGVARLLNREIERSHVARRILSCHRRPRSPPSPPHV